MYTFDKDVRKAYEAMPVAVVYDQLIDGKVVPLLVSDGFCELVEMDRAQTMDWFREGQFERLHPDDVGRVKRVSEDFIRRVSGYDLIFRSKHRDGYHVIHAVGKWQIMPDGTELALLTYSDITVTTEAIANTIENYQLFQKDHFFTDSLTGLPNLNYLNQFADERVHALRTRGEIPMLIFADVISMQYYNSQYGYHKGNELIRLIADSLRNAFPNALLMRGADDHFILIDQYESEDRTAEQVRATDQAIRRRAEGNTPGIKTGVCIYEPETQTLEALDHARNAMKWMGNDLNQTCQFYSQAAVNDYWNQRYVLDSFDRALENGWIRVYYQAIVRVQTGKGSAAEALARWIDPVRGFLPPDEFIPVLRKYHLLYKLDLYMAEQVCREVPARAQRGLTPLPVSVNFSAQDFEYIDIPTALNEIYERYHLEETNNGKLMIVEITEQDMATASEKFYEQLRRLRKNGFHVWIDDFGSGYSSLNVFSRFDVDLIKFDMDLLRNLDNKGGVNRRIIKAMTDIARDLGIHTLAEGMETEEHRAFLQEAGCELGQGYLYHRPEPLEATFYRLEAGEKPRICETQEERSRMVREWFLHS